MGSIMVAYDRTCSECNKAFMIPGSEYIYKIVQTNGIIKWYCCYTCWRVAQKNHIEKAKSNRTKMGRKKDA